MLATCSMNCFIIIKLLFHLTYMLCINAFYTVLKIAKIQLSKIHFIMLERDFLTSNLSNSIVSSYVKYHKEVPNHKTIDIQLHK